MSSMRCTTLGCSRPRPTISRTAAMHLTCAQSSQSHLVAACILDKVSATRDARAGLAPSDLLGLIGLSGHYMPEFTFGHLATDRLAMMALWVS